MEPKSELQAPLHIHTAKEFFLTVHGAHLRNLRDTPLVDAVFTMPPPLRVAILLVLAPAFAAGMTMRMVPPARVDAAITGSVLPTASQRGRGGS